MILLDTLILFFVTTLVVVLSPGPAAIAVAAEGASSGYKRSSFVILGIAMANVCYFILSATGIAALIIASHNLFMVIKWIGVVYLLYLGFGALFSDSGPLSINPSKVKSSSRYRLFLRGYILEISNPKALLYFSALLPQFVDVTKPVIPQLAILCFITLLLDLFCYSFYGYLGSKSRSAAIKPIIMKVINRSAGVMLIFAGLKMATVRSD